ncbi:uncharacterized protein A4U43_C09F8620 [Asparagus officinalis]|uniref:Cellulose synthase-like protein H1 n=2 Tax=Asparagus officinalis TaxID=4686 RepID=A0A5P1E6G0_ASPOF|nr:uncharacterized protein A4U43_C09F8620 [Asparagus officinalis]
MTNAPFILNVDCDMFANNPLVILHGMCLLLGFDNEVFSGFAQEPQQFYGALKDDPFGNQLVVLQKKLGMGIGGIQGPFYGGTGCFHRRKIIYGASPTREECNAHPLLNDELSYEDVRRIYGNSKELMQSVNEITSKNYFGSSIMGDLHSRIQAGREVASCSYELNTCWGKEIGWIYGSMTEDVLTGLIIQAKGWRSAYFTPDPPAFLGSAPTGGPASLTQYKRWAVGLLEILFDSNSPVLATLYKHLSFRQCLAYLVINTWAVSSIFDFCYALLPVYCFLANTNFLPKASSPEFLIPLATFTVFNITTFSDYLECGLSARTWWNNQRMGRIYSASSFLLAFLSVILKILGLSETIFEVTRKDQNSSTDETDEDRGRLTFDSSPLFVPGTALVMVHIAGMVTGAMRLVAGRQQRWGLGEVVCSAWVLLTFWPFVRGLFGKGNYGIPWAVVWKAVALGFVFLQICGLGQKS